MKNMQNGLNWIKDAILVLFSTLFALFLAEILLMIFEDKTPLNAQAEVLQPHDAQLRAGLELHDHEHHFCYGPKDRMRFDAALISREHGNQQYFEYRNEIVSLHTYDSYGFRTAIRKSATSNNFIVLGDSFTRGTLADDTETIPAFLTSWSSERVFFNFGIGGHGPTQHVINYQRNKSHFAHDHILLLYTLANDALNERDYSTKLAKAKKWHQAGIEPANAFAPAEATKSPEGFWGQFRLVQLLSGMRVEPTPERAESGLNQVNSPANLASLIADPIQALISIADSSAKPLSIVTLPSLEVYDERHFPKTHITYKTTLMIEQKKVIDSLASMYKVPVLHLDEAFDDAKIDPIGFYGWPDFHFNEYGYHAAALEIADFLAQQFDIQFSVESEFVNRTHYEPETATCPE